LASASAAQDESSQRAPSIRVYSQNGPIASNYVTPAIEVSEDAYVFAVSMDLDGQIQILHPDNPGISVRILKHRQLRLPNFFAGFSRGAGSYDGAGRYVGYSDYYAGSDNDSRGTVIALASRAPFNLERVESDGDWNISAIRRLVENRSPASAAHALAAYLGAKGEPIGTDYMHFASAQYHDYYASNSLYPCDLYYGGYGPSLGINRLAVLNQVAQLRRGGRSVAVLGYDFCGMPIVAYGPSRTNTRFQPFKPRNPDDSVRGRDHVRPRGWGQSAEGTPRAAAIGTFPITRRANLPQTGDATVTAPRPSGRDPRGIFNDRRNEGRADASAERSRMPVERSAPRRAETGFIGTQPSREYSQPLFREAPPQRSSPPPPAPRMQSEPRSRPVANSAPSHRR
jgi:hypothetical protein